MHLNPTQAQQQSTHVDHAINLLPGNTKLSYVTHVKLGFILIVKVWMTTCTTSWTRVTFHGNALIVGCLTFSQHFSTAQALNRPIVIPCLTVTYISYQLRKWWRFYVTFVYLLFFASPLCLYPCCFLFYYIHLL
jgi:hypothetical protein